MKILITSVSAGAGHTRAAQAIEIAVRREHPGIQISNVDAMDFVPKPFRKLYVDGYVSMVNRAPALWGFLYDAMDRAEKSSKTSRLMNVVQRANARPLLKHIAEFRPRRIVTTHFFLPQILGKHLGKGGVKIPVDVVVTDYDVHRIWLHDAVARYFVATDAIAFKMEKMGVARSKILVTGIPIVPVFSDLTDRAAILKSLDLEAGTPTLLLMAGGLGMGALAQTVKSLCNFPSKLQIIAVAGKNDALRAELERIDPPSRIRLRSLGFVQNMHELLSIADLVVSKPGGLTTSECFAKGAAMMVVSPIPGQEERNADYILENGAGLKAMSLEELEFKLVKLLGEPPRLARMKENSKRLARADAAIVIAGAVAGALKS